MTVAETPTPEATLQGSLLCRSAVSPKNLTAGYPWLAGQMALIPESIIVRKFTALNVQNVLHMQAELVLLEKRLRRVEEEERRRMTSHEWPLWARDWAEWHETVQRGARHEPNAINELGILWREIKSKLKDYNKAITQLTRTINLSAPSKYDRTLVQDMMATDGFGPHALNGYDDDVWGDVEHRTHHAHDLLGLVERHNEDDFSHLVTSKVTHYLFKLQTWLGRQRKPDPLNGLVTYRDETMLKFTRWISSLIAALLPIASILILYLVRDFQLQMAVIAGFNVLITACLLWFTRATRPEVFAVVMAFSAIEVVFVGVTFENSMKEVV